MKPRINNKGVITMEEKVFKSLDELFLINQQLKGFFKVVKAHFKLNFEEIYILNILNNCQGHEVTAKEIAQQTHLKPYYLTKALQKLKDLQLLSKKRSIQDERTVIVYVTKEQRERINALIAELEKYIQ